jgi:hypothetical protein
MHEEHVAMTPQRSPSFYELLTNAGTINKTRRYSQTNNQGQVPNPTTCAMAGHRVRTGNTKGTGGKAIELAGEYCTGTRRDIREIYGYVGWSEVDEWVFRDVNPLMACRISDVVALDRGLLSISRQPSFRSAFYS